MAAWLNNPPGRLIPTLANRGRQAFGLYPGKEHELLGCDSTTPGTTFEVLRQEQSHEDLLPSDRIDLHDPDVTPQSEIAAWCRSLLERLHKCDCKLHDLVLLHQASSLGIAVYLAFVLLFCNNEDITAGIRGTSGQLSASTECNYYIIIATVAVHDSS